MIFAIVAVSSLPVWFAACGGGGCGDDRRRWRSNERDYRQHRGYGGHLVRCVEFVQCLEFVHLGQHWVDERIIVHRRPAAGRFLREGVPDGGGLQEG